MQWLWCVTTARLRDQSMAFISAEKIEGLAQKTALFCYVSWYCYGCNSITIFRTINVYEFTGWVMQVHYFQEGCFGKCSDLFLSKIKAKICSFRGPGWNAMDLMYCRTDSIFIYIQQFVTYKYQILWYCIWFLFKTTFKQGL